MDGYKYRFIQIEKRSNIEEIIAHNYKYIYLFYLIIIIITYLHNVENAW